jgi:hypothetical protein
MAMGLLTATAGTGSGIFVVNFSFLNCIFSYQWAWLWACELTAHGPGLAYSHYGYRKWYFYCYIFCSTWALSYQWAWLWACELTTRGPRLAHSQCRYRQWFFDINFIFSLQFWVVNLLVCELVCTRFKALGLLTTTAGTAVHFLTFILFFSLEI